MVDCLSANPPYIHTSYGLLDYATEQALHIKGLRIIGEAEHKGAILSFVLDKIHPHDIGTMLDSLGIAIRARAIIAPCR